MPLPLGAILLAIDINLKLVTIDPKLKGTILNLFKKNRERFLSRSKQYGVPIATILF